ncbi:hypothetical protein PsYK624_097730 [Phanerochaete sordida]|uniref:Uncharacterized protein n=1 Tax=Phanerochaete sordida TaxID=48140 RepID=A0A9P3LGC6_9APHY|nr:hypothetical protein PsYK624_097730 [Phanerochaete sordida]
MYQKWSGSRSGSGSGSRPTGSGIGFLSRLPTFQPPSYYAAAAGLSPRTDSSTSKESHPEETTHAYNAPSGGPLSYPTADADAEDTGEPRRKRSLSRSLSRAMPGHHKEADARPREGSSRRQLAEIPLLETQLLPSLRDTIDRMTHPPGRTAQQDDGTRRRDDTESSDSVAAREEKARLVVSPQESRASRSPVVASGYVPTHASSSRGYASSNPATPAISNIPSPRVLGTPSLNANRSDIPLSPRAASKIPASPRIPTKSSLRLAPSGNDTLSPLPHSPLLSPAVDQSPGPSHRSSKKPTGVSDTSQSSRIPSQDPFA